MFKFNIKVDNIHNFKTVVNNTFEFILKSNHATAIKKLIIREEAKSKLTIGSIKLKLSIYKDTKLKDLPTTLRQFTGMYVYVRAKVRFNDIVQGVSSIYSKVITKGSIDNTTTSALGIQDKLTAKAMIQSNDVESSTDMRATRAMKGKFYDGATYENSEMINTLQAKTRMENVNNTSEEFEDILCAKTKLNNHGKSNMSMVCYQGKGKKLSLYADTKLSDLPFSLKTFCFDFANESWGDVLNTYSTWEGIKTNVSTWDNLAN